MNLKSLIVVLTIYLFTSCKKGNLNFETDSNSYLPGSVVKLKNKSQNYKNFIWTLPDGSKSNEFEPQYNIPLNQNIGTLTIKLKGYNNLKNRSEEVSKTINILGKGDIIFWHVSWGTGNVPINVTIDGVTKLIKYSSSSSVVCGDTLGANFNLPTGKHFYSATDGVKYWNGEIDVTNNTCGSLPLQ
ncbi:MAG: hypothetical protein ACK50A_16065 [Sphingobacteriaceae bacterium]|jgi:hypothetical protein